MKLIVLSSLIGATVAFAPSTSTPMMTTSLASSEEAVEEVAAPQQTLINGWAPDVSKPLYGLPGAVAPTGYFDPIGFCQTGISLNDVKRYREAEVQHGRVAM